MTETGTDFAGATLFGGCDWTAQQKEPRAEFSAARGFNRGVRSAGYEATAFSAQLLEAGMLYIYMRIVYSGSLRSRFSGKQARWVGSVKIEIPGILSVGN